MISAPGMYAVPELDYHSDAQLAPTLIATVAEALGVAA